MRAARLAVGTAHESPERMEMKCQRLCPPYNSQLGGFWQNETNVRSLCHLTTTRPSTPVRSVPMRMM